MNACLRCTLAQLGAALLAAGALVASSHTLKRVELTSGARVAVALAPLPFYGLLLWTMFRGVRKLDELRRRMLVESLAVAFAAGWLLLLTYERFVQAEIGAPPVQAEWILFLLIMLWIAGYGLVTRRY